MGEPACGHDDWGPGGIALEAFLGEPAEAWL